MLGKVSASESIVLVRVSRSNAAATGLLRRVGKDEEYIYIYKPQSSRLPSRILLNATDERKLTGLRQTLHAFVLRKRVAILEPTTN